MADGVLELVPRDNAEEAAVVTVVEICGIDAPTQGVGSRAGELPLEPTALDLDARFTRSAKHDVDFDDNRPIVALLSGSQGPWSARLVRGGAGQRESQGSQESQGLGGRK